MRGPILISSRPPAVLRHPNDTERAVRDICARLGTYTYHDVRNELKKESEPKKDGRRGNVGCTIPTERQLQYMLSRAVWSREILPPSKHSAAQYEYHEEEACQSRG